MRFNLPLHLRAVFAFTTLLFVCTSGFQVSFDGALLANNLDDNNLERTKREIENLDTAPDEFQTASGFGEEQQEESGFWDRVVKVALKLFSRFIEWLNS